MTSRLSFAGDQTPEFDFAALLGELGIVAVVVSCEADLESLNSDPSPHLALVDISSMTEPDLGHCVQRCLQMKLPTIALVPEERVGDLGASPGVDDFVVMPPMVDELVTRANYWSFGERDPLKAVMSYATETWSSARPTTRSR